MRPGGSCLQVVDLLLRESAEEQHSAGGQPENTLELPELFGSCVHTGQSIRCFDPITTDGASNICQLREPQH